MGILTCGQGAGVLIMAPVLQMMIDAYDWKTTYRIMAGVIFLMCLTALTYSPNVEGEDTEGTPAEEEDKEKGCYIDVSVWKEPKVLVLILSSTIIMFGHYTPQIHLVSLQFNNHKHSSKPKLGRGDGGINSRVSNNSRVVIRGEKVEGGEGGGQGFLREYTCIETQLYFELKRFGLPFFLLRGGGFVWGRRGR